MTAPLQPGQVEELDEILNKLDEAVGIGEGVGIDYYARGTTNFYLKDAKAAIERLLHRSNLEAQIAELRRWYFQHPSKKTAAATQDRIADLQQQLTEETQ